MQGEVKRASTCKGVSFTGSGVARSLPGIQLIAAWRVGVMRAVPARNAELLEAVAPGIVDPDGSSARWIELRAMPCRSVRAFNSLALCSREKFTYERRATRSRKYRGLYKWVKRPARCFWIAVDRPSPMLTFVLEPVISIVLVLRY